MKKKIINGFLMVALLAATVTSFVSCKDNDEDVKTDLIAQLQKQGVDLTNAYIAADNALNSALTTAYQNADAALKTDLQNWVEGKKYATEEWVKNYAENEQDFLKSAEFPDTLKKYLAENEDFKGVLNTLYGEDGQSGINKNVADLMTKVNDPENGVDAINDAINDEKTGLKRINERLDSVTGAINKLTEDFKNLITSVNVNATSTTLLANSKIFPGLNVQFVGAAFGKAVTTTGTFPTSTTADINGNKLDANYIAEGITPYEWEKGIINNKENNAGKVYFTVNPSNISANVLNNTVALSLTTSNNNEELVTLDNVMPSDKALSWGTTRGDSKVTLFEADATYDMTKADAIDPTKIIDFSALKENVKNIINAAKTVNIPSDATKAEAKETASTAKAASKVVLKEMAQAVANLVNSKIPALPALALKAEWKDNNVGTRNVISDYSLAATAYKPLSFNFGKTEGEILPTISLDRVDNAVYKVAKKLTSKITGLRNKIAGTNLDFSIDLSTLDPRDFNVAETVWVIVETSKETVDYETGTQDVVTIKKIYFTDDKTKVPTTAIEINDANVDTFLADKVYYNKVTFGKDLSEQMKTIKKAVEGGVDVSDIEDLLVEAVKMLNQTNNAVNKAATLSDRVTDYLQNYMNRAINFVNNGGISRALEPIMLVDKEQGLMRATGSYKAQEYTFVPTTVTYEIAAPAFKKYIAVIGKDGKARAADSKLLTKGDNNFSAVKLNLQQGDTKIVYDAMDFTGRHIIKVYDITVE